MRETTFTIRHQGRAKMVHTTGYCLVGGPDAVCFYIDPKHRASVSWSGQSDAGCPVIGIIDRDTDTDRETEIEFTEFVGWRFHAAGSGKTIAVALVRCGAEEV